MSDFHAFYMDMFLNGQKCCFLRPKMDIYRNGKLFGRYMNNHISTACLSQNGCDSAPLNKFICLGSSEYYFESNQGYLIYLQRIFLSVTSMKKLSNLFFARWIVRNV